ncbi:Spc24p [Saccharomyces cerevisiae x Saccharomyces kudriavzevii VIN7]|uniref:Kinetochore protein Spc24 n=1 Tax=Saccharomyces cerevisiae x Saccharomyces kudriavzevii (strain VIN7) TaxID=1095631 RepID=H0GZC9_SACCK|nr:Spc24p [Saccharomyces cerevisiae x Saccharomyces kudriavzevii VIN7]
MSQKENLLDNPVEFLKEVRESFNIQQDVDAMRRIRHDLDIIREESEAKIAEEKSTVSESNRKLNAERINVAKLEGDLEYTNEEGNEFGSRDNLVKLFNDLDGLERNIVSLRSELDEKMKLYIKDSEIVSTSDGSEINPRMIESEMEDQSGITSEANENILKLKLYRSLGVILDLENNQVLISRKNDGNIDVLPLDDSLSDYYKTKYIWERLGK